MLARLRGLAQALKRAAILLWLAARHPGVPRLPKLLAAVVAAYAFSPIDLMPDIIPVLGLLDELILLPGLVWLTLRMIPPTLRTTLEAEATRIAARPASRIGAVVVVLVWLGGAVALVWWWFA